MHLFKRIVIHFLRFLIKSDFVTSLHLYVFFKTLGIRTRNQNRLKISVINTQDLSGGAANIAYQLSKEIGKELPLKLYVFSKFRVDDWIQKIPEYSSSLFYELLKKHALAKGYIEFTGMHSITLFQHLFFKDSSIVHIHNLHGEFLSPMLFEKLFKHKKVIWTLHDESFNTGHCSCTLGCEKWKTGCGECPDLSIYPSVNFDNTKELLRLKKEILHKLNPIIVSPSYWLAQRVRIAYPTISSIKVIPNGVDLSIFKLANKLDLRNKFNLKSDAKIVLFVAEFSTKNPFKGGEIIRDLLGDNTLKDITFITVGGVQPTLCQNHLVFPYIESQTELAELYAMCDLMVYPTKADNLPLVVLESMACGTPVIASKIGGIPEIIKNNSLGYLVEDFNTYESFKANIEIHFNLASPAHSEMQKNCRMHIEQFFSKDQMVSNYLELYKEC